MGSLDDEQFIILLEKSDLKTIEQIYEIIALEEKAKEEGKAAKEAEVAKAKQEEEKKEKANQEVETKFKLRGKEITQFFENLDDQEIKLFDCPDCNKQISVRAMNCPECGGPVTSQQLIISRAIQWLEEHCKDEYATYIYPNKVVLKFAEICENELKEGDYYIGETKNGMAGGKGIFCWNGNIYVGEFTDCLCDGIGRTIYKSGAVYEGEYKDDQPHGQGTRKKGGDKYVGEYKDGEYHGQGTYTYASGDKYVGELKDGKKNGKGTYTFFGKGGKYIGEYKDGKYHGQGTYYYPDGRIYKKGLFEDDKFISE